jgi:hypothetical protein
VIIAALSMAKIQFLSLNSDTKDNKIKKILAIKFAAENHINQ